MIIFLYFDPSDKNWMASFEDFLKAGALLEESLSHRNELRKDQRYSNKTKKHLSISMIGEAPQISMRSPAPGTSPCRRLGALRPCAGRPVVRSSKRGIIVESQSAWKTWKKILGCFFFFFLGGGSESSVAFAFFEDGCLWW